MFNIMLKSTRMEYNMSSWEFAMGIGCTQSYITTLERGERLPSHKVVNAIADYLDRGENDRAAWFKAAEVAHTDKGVKW